jgi:hemerythrin
MNTENTVKVLIENRKKIEDLIDNFSRYVETDDCDKVIVELFHKISFYTNEYLMNERLFLKQKDVELFNQIVDKHRKFTDKLISFQKDFEQKKPDFCEEFLDFLKNWYAEQILYFDKNIMKHP